jgi:L-threonylcarbamoyladenylate synthase
VVSEGPVIVAAGDAGAVAPAGPVVGALLRGDVVVVPTDTVYGVAALPGVPGATGRLFDLKGRTADVPLAVLCADPSQAWGLAGPVHPDVEELAAKYWPGPLTLVLPRRPGLALELGEPAGTVGVRCPQHDLVQQLAAVVGPIATTSANLHGEPTPGDAAGVVDMLGHGLSVVVDGGPCRGEPSTVLDVTGGSRSTWRLLRPGPVTP